MLNSIKNRILVLFAAGLLFLCGHTFAQQQCEGEWDLLMGKYITDACYTSAICVDQNRVYVGGYFRHSTWQNEGKGFGFYNAGRIFHPDGGVDGEYCRVRALYATENGMLVGGLFDRVKDFQTHNIALWTDAGWKAFGAGTNGEVHAVIEFQGRIYAGGEFTRAGNQKIAYLSRWNGQAWEPVGAPLNGPVYAMAIHEDALYVGGRFTKAGDLEVNHIACFDGSAWSALGPGVNGSVQAITVLGDDLILGGRFERAGSMTVNKICGWTGNAFEPLGQGFWGNVLCLAADGENLYAGGEFTYAPGYDQPFNYMACWNGSGWLRLGDGLTGPAFSIGVRGKDIYVGGCFPITNTIWQPSTFYPYYSQFYLVRWRNPVPEFPFRRISSDPFPDFEYCSSFSWRDYDGDGDEDIYMASYMRPIFRNEGNGTFTRAYGGHINQDASVIALWCDFDNDGDQDQLKMETYYFNNQYRRENCVYINNGSGTLYRRETLLPQVRNPGDWYRWACWTDLDSDGWNDLIMIKTTDNEIFSVESFLNIAGHHFSFHSTLSFRIPYSCGLSPCFTDIDQDGDMDILCIGTDNSSSHANINYLLNNDGCGQFTWQEIDLSTLKYLQSASCAFGDYDNDGDQDLVLTNRKWLDNALFENRGSIGFEYRSDSPVSNDQGNSESANWCDYDNDGDLDLFIFNIQGSENYMYENLGNGNFHRIYNNPYANAQLASKGGIWYDYNRDGYQDLLMAGSDFALFENTASGNYWLNLKLVGVKSNRDALGARAHVKAVIRGEPVLQTRTVYNQDGFLQNSLEQVFGLGDAAVAENILIEWPSGIWQVLSDVEADQFLTITEDTSETALSKIMNLSAREALLAGLFESTGKPALNESALPVEYVLLPCVPNPFNPSTEIRYELPRPAHVNLRVFNARGQVMLNLVNELQPSGRYQVLWNGCDDLGTSVPSGLYLCRLETAGVVKTIKMILVR
jgi:hypothetical protein